MLKDIRNASLGALAVLALAAPAPAQSCAGDLNNDGVINGADIGILLSDWGPTMPVNANSDINRDEEVNGADLGVLLSNWEACQIITPSWATLVEARPHPDVVTDPVLRAAIWATGLAWRVRDTATQVEMLLVPPGTFQMGCVIETDQFGCQGQEFPVHQVTLTNAFYLGRCEVTQAQWEATMGSNPSYFQGYAYSETALRPVEQVSWNTVQGYMTATGFRLPTEAEWEHACRAGTQTPFYNGSTNLSTLMTLEWYRSNSHFETRPVGRLAANPFGLYDMLGNVAEWVNDWHDGYTSEAQTNPTGPVNGAYRVFRGGSYGSTGGYISASVRWLYEPDGRGKGLGFRVARNP